MVVKIYERLEGKRLYYSNRFSHNSFPERIVITLNLIMLYQLNSGKANALTLTFCSQSECYE